MIRKQPIPAHADPLRAYLDGSETQPMFVQGHAADVLAQWPAECIDFCMTSPPYFGHRRYESGGIGEERTFAKYIDNLSAVFAEVSRVLKPTGSLWLNLGDTYRDKALLGIPWRVALRLTDEGWTLRNDIIWHKVKGGPDNARDKLRNVHEHLFHFVRDRKGYFYDADAIRTPPNKARVEKGAVVSATGVTGVRYKRQIELSTVLGAAEKRAASDALAATLEDVRAGRLSDFRMIIRGQQRTTHSDRAAVSGRAKELNDRGFYFLRYHPKGAKPSDVWDVMPEDTQKRSGSPAAHFAPYPLDLCRIPILSTCPAGGVALDPFAGTGTTMLAAFELGHRSIGIDLAPEYLDRAQKRCAAMASAARPS